MIPPTKISRKVIERICKYKSPEFKGKLYGVIVKRHLTVLGLQISIENAEDLNNSLPAELDVCGTFVGGEEYDEDSVKKDLNDVDITDNPIFLHLNSSKKPTLYCYINEKLEETNYTPIEEEEVLQNFLYVRLRAPLTVSCELTEDSIRDTFQDLRKKPTSGMMAFHVQESEGRSGSKQVYLIDNSVRGVSGVSDEITMGELCDYLNEDKKNKKQNRGLDVLHFSMLICASNSNITNHAPLCIVEKKRCRTMKLVVTIDCLALLHRQTNILELYEILVEAATRNLRLYEDVIMRNLHSKNISQPQVFHFYPQNLDHFVTRIYLKDHSEKFLVEERRILHEQFLLPLTYPLFRRGNQYDFYADLNPNEPIINPHEGLKATDNNGKVSLVRGKYAYYHYGQQGEDDKGWGCAYRSLQTLASWYKFQGYTCDYPPTLKQIQKCLVEIGDKPESFVGSKEWIGSTEVGYVLDTLLGVSCKILHVSSGDEMSTKGPELVHHFDTQGSPIMIGGGLLAHTILGVDYNSQTGAIKFLILDPHYTGVEDLHVIQNKGWCGWKGMEFWVKTTYYNMCLPQVPIGV